MKPRVWNRHHAGVPEDAVNIMRSSEWGNWFKIMPGRTREQSIAQHRAMVMSDSQLRDHIRQELHGKDLLCCCKPKACHGDTLLEVANLDPLV